MGLRDLVSSVRQPSFARSSTNSVINDGCRTKAEKYSDMNDVSALRNRRVRLTIDFDGAG
jgi:hypothetical protein